MKSVTKYKNNNYFIKLGISPVVPSFNVQGNLEKNNFVIEMGSFRGLHSKYGIVGIKLISDESKASSYNFCK